MVQILPPGIAPQCQLISILNADEVGIGESRLRVVSARDSLTLVVVANTTETG